MTKKIAITAGLLALAISAVANASAFPMPFHGIAAGLGVGTEGIGVQATTNIIPKTLNLNIGFSTIRPSESFTSGNVNYNATFRLQGEPITLSWFPFHGNFNLTAGLFLNQNRFAVTAVPDASGTYTINGNTYTTSQINSISGHTNFNAVAPYVGIGWGDPMDGGRLTLTANVGAIYEGAPDVTLAASGPEAGNAQVQQDIAAEQENVNSHLNGFQWWPVASLGLMYRF